VIILKDILYKVAIEAVHGSKEVAVGKIEFDSRKIEVNDVCSYSWFCFRRA
jgi:UDP-N-acetylmuramoyl-L-alanyl-D-glutamate--2,6-diaminopimelate ligase